jgi:hypothetical protein
MHGFPGPFRDWFSPLRPVGTSEVDRSEFPCINYTAKAVLEQEKGAGGAAILQNLKRFSVKRDFWTLVRLFRLLADECLVLHGGCYQQARDDQGDSDRGNLALSCPAEPGPNKPCPATSSRATI